MQTPSFMSTGTTIIELREFKEKEKKKKNNGQNGIILAKSDFAKIFATQLSFDMCCTVKSLLT